MSALAQHDTSNAQMEVRILVGNSSGCDGALPDAPARTPFQNGGSPPPSFQAHWLLTSHNCTTQGCINAVQQTPSLLARNSEPLWRAIPAAELMDSPLYCNCLILQLLLSTSLPSVSQRCSPILLLHINLGLFPSNLS